jgi:hypothetical protein
MNQGNILDLVFCDNFSACSYIFILPPFSSSDHSSLAFTLFIDSITSVEELVSYIDYKGCNHADLNACLTNINWHEALSNASLVEVMWDKLFHIIKSEQNISTWS